VSFAPAIRAGAWIERWRPILPLLVAECILWLGFGALLPILPLYFTENGIDLATLGLVVAAWPAARLVGEPVFGWLADRSSRKLLMILGLVAAGLFTALPLVVTGPAAFIALRALTGLSTSLYDPAARGYLTDATPARRRGEAFGLYASAQMAGLLFGPLLGAIGAGLGGGIGVVFVLGAASSLLGAVAIAVALVDLPRQAATSRLGPAASTELNPDPPAAAGRLDREVTMRALPGIPPDVPRSLWNRLLASAVVLHFGLFFAVGTSEVVWSLYLTSIGAGLDLIGLTFAAFGLPVVIVSPLAGRLVDRRGSFGPIVVGSLTSAAAAFVYPAITIPLLTIPVIVLEGAGTSFCDPALYSIVGRGSPAGRSSTAQGIFGAAGTVGFIVSSVLAGWLAGVDLRFPFLVTAAAILITLIVALVIAGPAIRRPVARERTAEPQWGQP
jgi:MFS family permease